MQSRIVLEIQFCLRTASCSLRCTTRRRVLLLTELQSVAADLTAGDDKLVAAVRRQKALNNPVIKQCACLTSQLLHRKCIHHPGAVDRRGVDHTAREESVRNVFLLNCGSWGREETGSVREQTTSATGRSSWRRPSSRKPNTWTRRRSPSSP